MQAVQEWLNGLEQRERLIVLVGGVLVILMMFYAFLIDPLYSGVSERETRIAEKQALLGWMEAQAASMPKGGRARPTGGGNVMVLFSQAVRRSGLDSYNKGTTPTQNTDGLRVRFEAAPFDKLIPVLGDLSATHSLMVTQASMETARTTGTIDARITLEKPGT